MLIKISKLPFIFFHTIIKLWKGGERMENSTCTRVGIKHRMKFIPNILTLLRIPLTVIYIGAFISFQDSKSSNYLCISILVLILLTDIMDGKVARRFNAQSKLGSILDSYCDLVFILCTSILFNYYNLLSIGYTLLIILKFAEFNITSHYMEGENKKPLVFDKIGRIVAAGYFLVPIFINISFLNEFIIIYIILISAGTVASSFFRIYSIINAKYNSYN